jgi:hypothetical protein
MTQWLLVVLLIGISVTSAGAQTKSFATREPRVALVIGNAAYADVPLNKPGNDARGVAQALHAQGFEVIERVDADVTTMRRAVAQFGEKMREGGIGLFYYSGHGMQVNGRNFLVPVGAQIASEAYISAETLDVDSVLGQMDAAKSRVNIVILDACRNNPFARRFRSQTRGLAFMQAPLGTFIVYATSPGDVADDGPRGGYGVFTGELLKAIKEPLAIETLFKCVTLAVQQKTERRQTPWIASNLTGDFAFVSGAVVASVAPPPEVSPPTSSRVRPTPPPEAELARPNHPGWSIDASTGCWLWNNKPRAGETVSWSGGCGADGRATGQGVAESTWDDKVERAEGDYVGGRLNGRGVLTMPDGGRYEGEVRDGKPDGRGVLTMANGASRYEGEFRDGKPNGFSTYSWPSGKLTGTWTNGCGRDGLRTAWVGTTREQCGF